MSAGGHHNVCELSGVVETFCRGPDGHIRGVLLKVDTGEPAMIPVLLPKETPRLQRGQHVFLKGHLQTERVPGAMYPLVCVVATYLVLVKRPRAPQEEQRHGGHDTDHPDAEGVGRGESRRGGADHRASDRVLAGDRGR